MRTALACFIVFAAAACGGDVIANPGQSGDEASGVGAGPASSSVASSTTGGVGGASAACNQDSYVEQTSTLGDALMTSSCAQSWGAMWSSAPVGFYVNGGPAPGAHYLAIEGCASADATGEGIRIGAPETDVPGDYAGNAVYKDTQGQEWTDMDGSVKLALTAIGPVGATVEGSYVGQLFHGAGVIDVKGAFVVCHVEDENVP